MKSLLNIKALVLAVTCASALAQTAQATVLKSQRELLVVANLQTAGDPRLVWLYQFLDASAVSLAQLGLGGSYRRINVLAGSAATKNAFTNTIGSKSQSAGLQALDVFVHVHGSPGRLHFEDGSRDTDVIKSRLADLSSNNKLRLLYSTACYGRSHAQDFVDGGFKVANGARGVNANSSFEYPVIIAQWGAGQTFSTAQTLGNDANMRNIHDSGARAMGFAEADSFKVIRGSGSTRITSSAQ